MLDPTSPPNWENMTTMDIATARLVCPAVLSPAQTVMEGERQ